jgi:hypothetical protein
MLQPTLSRVHHIGSSSQVGNSHSQFLRKCTPWSNSQWNDLLHSIELGKHIGFLSNLQGLPCRDKNDSSIIYMMISK